MKIQSRKLTPDQLRIVAAIAEGLSAKMVASKLGVSIHIINNNLKAVYRALDIHSNTCLLRWYFTERQLAPVIKLNPNNSPFTLLKAA